MLKRFSIGMAAALMAALLNVLGLGTGFIATGLAAEADAGAQSNTERGVKVTVVPKNFSAGATWEFEVKLETHTQPLNDDLAKTSALVADGKSYSTQGWEGAPPGGHHRKGILRFTAIVPRPQSVELQIQLSGDAHPRKFRWSLSGAGNGQ